MGEDFIYYKVSTNQGKSGAPLIVYFRQGVFKIIGIHLGHFKRHGKETNYALRINEKVIKKLE